MKFVESLINSKDQNPEPDLYFGISVADPDPGSGAFANPVSGRGFFRIPGLGSQTHIF